MHSIYIEYRNPEIQPPLYLTGSFGNPPWCLQPMQCVEGDNGERTFVAHVWVQAGRDYQYKFTASQDGPWLLDERRPIVSDPAGNKNNLLHIPSYTSSNGTQEIRPELQNDLRRLQMRASTGSMPTAAAAVGYLQSPEELEALKRSQTQEVASKNTKVADNAQDSDRLKPLLEVSDSEEDEEDDIGDVEEPLRTPLFAHESMGGYDFVDDRFDHGYCDGPEIRQQSSRSGSRDYMFDEEELNDPALERFPSDSSSVLEALNKIDSGSSVDHSHFEDFLQSSCFTPRRESIDSGASTLSSGSLSPTSVRKRDNILSSVGFGRTKSVASLGSIAEEEPKQLDGNMRTSASGWAKRDSGSAFRS